MERTLSIDERIKKAEEIYYKRKMQEDGTRYSRVYTSSAQKNTKLLKRVLIQILICAAIYTLVYFVKDSKYIFSEVTINKINEVLSYDINVNKLYADSKKYIESLINAKDNGESINQNIIDNENVIENVETTNMQENVQIQELNAVTEEETTNKSENYGENKVVNKVSDLEMQIPLKGEITSRFGPRESQNPIVSKNHTGIDIAAQEGTVFCCSMEGIVDEVSNEGELGKHLKVTNGNVSTVYAHCSEIYVKEGDKINMGQSLGEVGQTR